MESRLHVGYTRAIGMLHVGYSWATRRLHVAMIKVHLDYTQIICMGYTDATLRPHFGYTMAAFGLHLLHFRSKQNDPFLKCKLLISK